MVRLTRTSIASALLAVATLSAGCQSLGRIFYRPDPPAVRPISRVVLATDLMHVQPPSDPPSGHEPAGSNERDRYDEPPDDAEPPATQRPEPAPPERAARKYTAPPPAVRTLALGLLGAATAQFEPSETLTGAGKEVSETMLGTGAETAFARPGLAAPQTVVSGAVVSRPGLQEGPATGLGFASPFNLLTPQVNPLSGPQGRCADLAAAGFFNGSRPACEANFRP